MGTREGLWDGATLLWRDVDEAAWAALPAPPGVRAILGAWAAPWDAAPLLPRGRDPAPLLECYRAVAAGRPVDRMALALLNENASLNRDFGLWRDLRAEAARVLDWLAPLAANGALADGLPAISPARPAPPCTSPGSAAIA